MMLDQIKPTTAKRFVLVSLLALTHGIAHAQFGGALSIAGPARDIAPIDLTGQWVSVVTEDWRFRMVTPPKNDFPGLPLNEAARAHADAWDPQRDIAEGSECKAYGVGGIMRIPGRIRIEWRDESTMTIRTDAGRQERTLHFDGTEPPFDPSAERTWQGVSVAEWELHRPSFRAAPVHGALKVTTSGMRAGYIRKNGVPYSEDALVTEHYDLLTQHDGSVWLQILTIVDDPTYFTTPIITSTNFRQESERGRWSPEPCRVD